MGAIKKEEYLASDRVYKPRVGKGKGERQNEKYTGGSENHLFEAMERLNNDDLTEAGLNVIRLKNKVKEQRQGLTGD